MSYFDTINPCACVLEPSHANRLSQIESEKNDRGSFSDEEARLMISFLSFCAKNRIPEPIVKHITPQPACACKDWEKRLQTSYVTAFYKASDVALEIARHKSRTSKPLPVRKDGT